MYLRIKKFSVPDHFLNFSCPVGFANVCELFVDFTMQFVGMEGLCNSHC